MNKTDPAIIRRLDNYPEHEHARIVAYKAYTYEGMITRSQAEIDWAIKGLHLIDQITTPPINDLISATDTANSR
ncbi:hypothetical protein M2260_000174 [Rhodococcus erythropolis]|nr:hypothetical protein [Rhodococcus erythropolis]